MTAVYTDAHVTCDVSTQSNSI